MFYKIYNVVIETDVQFPELETAEPFRNFCEFHFHADSKYQKTVAWYHQWVSADGAAWMQIGRSENLHVLTFFNIADFTISSRLSRIDCYCGPDIPIETIRHLFLNQVFPLFISSVGGIVLHGSAVVTNQGAIAFLGETGLGKSTLAASFGRRGFSILTDDSLFIQDSGGVLMGIPSYPAIRLWPGAVESVIQKDAENLPVAHYSQKRRISGNDSISFSRESAPILRMFLLSRSTESNTQNQIKITPVPAREAFVELVKLTYRLDIEDRNRLSEDFHTFIRMASRSNLFHFLEFPRDYAVLPAVQEAVLLSLNDLS